MLPASTIRQPVTETQPDQVSLSILKILLYFKVFDYPIKKEELFTYVCDDNKINVQAALARMATEGIVQIKDDFVWVSNPETIITRRLEANQQAFKALRRAKKQAKLLSYFPFIKCICISGSLSKYFMEKGSDIDYFIIVEEKRLWITRFLFSVIGKMLRVAGQAERFCPNYIITDNNLSIRQRNIYTAMEIITLIPVYNQNSYEDFLRANDWVRSYFPHYECNIAGNVFQYKKTSLHVLWQTRIFTYADRLAFLFFRKRISSQLNKGKLKLKREDICITEEEYKYHKDHKNTILSQYSKNVIDFSRRYGIELHPIEAIW